MTNIHQINLSDDAFYLLACIFGMWHGTEMSFDYSPRQIMDEEDGYKVYTEFTTMLGDRFGNGLTGRFATAFEELARQLRPRPEEQ